MKENNNFVCKECGYESAKWLGKCPVCNNWDTFKEVSKIIGKSSNKKNLSLINEDYFESLKDVKEDKLYKIKTNIKEFDGVLGGGIVPGMVCIIGGEPGVGKTTLLMQISQKIALQNKKVLYASGEESLYQIKQRSSRIEVESENIFVLSTVYLENILEKLTENSYDFLVIDSIQAISLQESSYAMGSLAQLRETTTAIVRFAKTNNLPVFLVGHITKDGMVAGPKIIEHIVDAVLYLESSSYLKILKTSKNRFGSTNEIGVFQMQNKGLMEVNSIAKLFINEEESIGLAISCTVEGSRAFLVEVESLVNNFSNYGIPQRVFGGFDQKKVSMLIAVIEKVLKINLRNSDIFVNMIGGLKTKDPCLDLAIVFAILSSYKNKLPPSKTAFLGEVGLNGNIRKIGMMEKRIKECQKLGFENIVAPLESKNENIIKVDNLNELYRKFFI